VQEIAGVPAISQYLTGTISPHRKVGDDGITMLTEARSQAVDRLTAEGYTDDFRAEPGGLRAVVADVLDQPEALAIEEVVRKEELVAR
jgi:hypothetical protein